MAVTFELPPEIETTLREQLDDLDQAAKEAFLVELYRQRKLTDYQLGKALGLSRYETDGLLKRHEVYHDLNLEDIARESEAIRKLRDNDANRR